MLGHDGVVRKWWPISLQSFDQDCNDLVTRRGRICLRNSQDPLGQDRFLVARRALPPAAARAGLRTSGHAAQMLLFRRPSRPAAPRYARTLPAPAARIAKHFRFTDWLSINRYRMLFIC
jgi:hypothetical protein